MFLEPYKQVRELNLALISFQKLMPSMDQVELKASVNFKIIFCWIESLFMNEQS